MDTNTDNKLRLFTRGQGKRLQLRGLRRRWLASREGPNIVLLVLVGEPCSCGGRGCGVGFSFATARIR